MHKMYLGKRNLAAQQRIIASAELLAKKFDMDPALISGLKVQEKDKEVRAMKERERVANLLEEICISLHLMAPSLETSTQEAEPVTAETGTQEAEPAVVEEDADLSDDFEKEPVG